MYTVRITIGVKTYSAYDIITLISHNLPLSIAYLHCSISVYILYINTTCIYMVHNFDKRTPCVCSYAHNIIQYRCGKYSGMRLMVEIYVRSYLMAFHQLKGRCGSRPAHD